MKTKKVFSLLLIVMMLGSLVPATAFAEDSKPQLTKRAEWIDQEKGLAKITLEAKGNPVVMPKKGADVVVVMDYSGSMEYAASKEQVECGKKITWSSWYEYYKIKEKAWKTVYTGKCPDRHSFGTVEVNSGTKPADQYCTEKIWKTETRWQAAKNALNTLLGQILSGNNGDSKVAFVAFDSTVESKYKTDFTDKSGEIMSKVNSLSEPHPGTGKGTNYTAGLSQAITYLNARPDKTRPAYVVFLSDGEPTEGDGSNQIKDLKKISKIYTIGFGLDSTNEASAIARLKNYASQPEYFRNVQTSSELSDLFNNIGVSITNPGVTVWDTIDTSYFTLTQNPGTSISYVSTNGTVKYTDGKKFEWHLDNFSPTGDTLTIYVQLKNEYIKTGESYPTNEAGTAKGSYVDSKSNPIELVVTEDVVSSAVPRLATKKKYQITFAKGEHGKLTGQDGNGNVVIPNILSGRPLPKPPTVTADPGYTFTGWNPVLPEKVTADGTYVAQYKKTAEDWKIVTFDRGLNGTLEGQNADGKVIKSDILVDSTFPAAPKATPEKGYEFTGWSEALPATVTETKTYIALYEKIAEDWKIVTFDRGLNGTLEGQNADGKVIKSDILVDNTFPEAPKATPEKGYKFTGWSAVLPVTVTETKTYIALYEKIAEDWKIVTFDKGLNGTLEGQTAEGKVIKSDILIDSIFPAAPKVTAEKGYKFTGWSTVLPEKVTENATYTAQYIKLPTVTFKIDSSKSDTTGTVIFAEPGTSWNDLSKPGNPVGKKIGSDSVYKKYEFVEWGTHPSKIETDVVVEAVFETHATIQLEELYFREGSEKPESSLAISIYHDNKANSEFAYSNVESKSDSDGHVYEIAQKQVFINGNIIESGSNNINFDLTSVQGIFPEEIVHVKNIYKEIPRHYVVYQSESQSEVAGMPTADKTIFYDGHNKPFTISSMEPTRSGYTFIGWMPSIDSSKVFKSNDEIVVSNSSFDFSQKNLVLQAVWEPNEDVWNYNVKYYKDGESEPFATSENTVLKRSNKVTSVSDRAPEYYKLREYKFNNEEIGKTLDVNITEDGQNINVYYEKNDLIVKHAYGNITIYDEGQSKADADNQVTVNFVRNGRYSVVRSIIVNGITEQVPQTSITLDFTKDNKYEVIFVYGSRSGGSTTDPEDNASNERNDNGYFGEPVTILDEEVALAAGLDSIDHFAYMFGYEDNTVRPKNRISREEVSTIFYRLLTDEFRDRIITLDQKFPDVKNTRWSNKPIATLANGKIIGGYPDASFKPGSSITRAEFAAIVSRFDNLSYQGEDKFSDIKGHWAVETINAAAERGWIGGYPDGTFRPNEYITRAEATALINKVLNRKVSEEGLLENARYWKDNSRDAWYYEDVIEATNSHDYERDEATGIEKWTEIKVDKVWP